MEDIRMYVFVLLTIILYIYRMYKNLSPEQIEAFVRNAKR